MKYYSVTLESPWQPWIYIMRDISLIFMAYHLITIEYMGALSIILYFSAASIMALLLLLAYSYIDVAAHYILHYGKLPPWYVMAIVYILDGNFYKECMAAVITKVKCEYISHDIGDWIIGRDINLSGALRHHIRMSNYQDLIYIPFISKEAAIQYKLERL